MCGRSRSDSLLTSVLKILKVVAEALILRFDLCTLVGLAKTKVLHYVTILMLKNDIFICAFVFDSMLLENRLLMTETHQTTSVKNLKSWRLEIARWDEGVEGILSYSEGDGIEKVVPTHALRG